MRGDGFTTIYILSTRPIGKSAGKHCLWDYRYIYRNPPPGIYQRRNHSCFFRRNRVRIVCRNFPDIVGSRLLRAFRLEWLSRRKDMREDSAIAVFWTLGMALGIMFSFLSPGFAPDLSAYLFGNILTINQIDLWMLGILALILTGFFYLFIRPIVYIAFDREFARSQKIPVEIFEYVLMMFIALTIVACLRMVGIVLVISLLTIPQVTANIFTHSFKRMALLSIVTGYSGCLGGLYLSYHYNIPSGASIIFVSILIYLVCKGISWSIIRWRRQ